MFEPNVPRDPMLVFAALLGLTAAWPFTLLKSFLNASVLLEDSILTNSGDILCDFRRERLSRYVPYLPL